MLKKLFFASIITTSTLLASCSTVEASKSRTFLIQSQTQPTNFKPNTQESDIEVIIFEVAHHYGIDHAAFKKMAQIESNFNPDAYHPKSKACGLFQFIPSTANIYNLTNCRDPKANAEAAAKLWLDNAAFLQRNLGRTPTLGQIYLAHQQGPKGAVKLLANPNLPAFVIVGKKAVLQNGGQLAMTANEFADLWTQKFM